MTWIPDNETCDYLPISANCPVRAIGWLEGDQPYPQGEAPVHVYEKLKALFQKPFEPVRAAGGHSCSLCHYDSGGI